MSTTSELIKKTAYDLGLTAIEDLQVQEHIKKARSEGSSDQAYKDNQEQS